MGKSRLSLTSSAYARQMKFYCENQSRLEKNKFMVRDPLNYEDGVSLFDPLDRQDDDNAQNDNGNTSSHKIVPHTVVKVGGGKRETKIRGLKGARKPKNLSENDNACTRRNFPTGMSKHLLIELLDNKRESTREKALSELVDTFERNVLPDFLETMCITFFYKCLNSFVVGSANESYLASRVIGLLAITVGTGSNSHELMQNSISKFSLVWKHNCEFLKLSVLECLAITTFFGAIEVDEVENAMRIMWDIFRPTSISETGMVNKPTAVVLAKAISAWSLLLTTIDSWRISLQLWKESISIFFTLLEDDDCWVRVATTEAIAAIFETGRLDKFMRKDDADSTEIINKIKKLVDEAKDSSRKDLKNTRETLHIILEFLETGNFHEESIKIPNRCDHLTISTVTQSIELKFFKRFLGSNGFLKHMQDNRVLHGIFDYKAKEIENKMFEEKVKEIPTLKAHKQRIQSRNEHRMWVEDMHYGYGHFDVTCQD